MRSFFFRVSVLLLFFSVAIQSYSQAQIYVNAAAAGTNKGTSWANAYTSIQTAITAAVAGNEIWVARGDYGAGATAASTFLLKNGVRMYGGFAGTETAVTQRVAAATGLYTVNESILDGGNVNNHVVSVTTAVGNGTVLDGFTIAGGYTVTAPSTAAANKGPGIYNLAGSAVFQNLYLRNNYSGGYGAAIFNSGTSTFKNMLIEYNGFFALNSAGLGGGIYNAAAATYTDVIIRNNGNVYAGGGFYNVTAGTVLNNIEVSTTGVSTYGGGIWSSADIVIDRARILANAAVQRGGGIYSASGTITLRNAIINQNYVSGATAGFYGGGMYVAAGTANIQNCTFSYNTIAYYNVLPAYYGAGLYTPANACNIYNSIFWGNSRNSAEDQINTITLNTLSSNIIKNGFATGTNTILGDPEFENPGANDLRLKAGSVAIDAGDNSAVLTTKDAAGNTRIVNTKVDIGALENPTANTGALQIAPATVAAVARGAAFSQQFTATGGSGPVTWAVTYGAPPLGITLNAQTGLLSGVAIIPGTNTFVVKATSGSMVISRQYTMQVNAGSTRIYVNEATPGANNGANWANAFNRLQSALTLAKDGDEIWVARGTYAPTTISPDSTFTLLSGVKMYGGFAGTETTVAGRVPDAFGRFTVNETYLYGYNFNRHVVSAVTPLSTQTLLDGFSIAGGSSNSLGGGIYSLVAAVNGNYRNLVIKLNAAVSNGAGMYNTAAAVKLDNVLFDSNVTTNAGGTGAGLWNSAANTILNNVTFRSNTASQGAGFYNSGATVTITNSWFDGNNASVSGGGMLNTGAGLTVTSTKFQNNAGAVGGGVTTNVAGVFKDVMFRENRATTTFGGGMSGVNMTLDRVAFIGNTSVQHGGGLFLSGATNTLSNIVFSRNYVSSTGAFYGGGMYFVSGAVNMYNTTFSNNVIARTPTNSGGGLYRAAGTVNIYNSIFWGNTRGDGTPDQLFGPPSTPTYVGWSTVQGGYTGGETISLGDPLFKNAAIDSLSLKIGSLAIDKGNNSQVIGTVDIDGNPRKFNTTVDQGAYESQGGPSIKIAPASIPSITRGTDVDIPLIGTGGAGPLTWTIVAGTLPPGLTMSADGKITGRAMVYAAAGYTVAFSVTDGELVGSKQYVFTIVQAPARIYVRQEATGNNNGSSWANGFTDLQTAITQATAGDEIWVARGNYSPGAVNTTSFTLKEGVKMYGGFAGTETLLTERVSDVNTLYSVNESLLNGNGVSYHVVNNAVALTSATVIDGFSIAGGKAIVTTSSQAFGTGVYNNTGAAVYRNLWIKDNVGAYIGGGIYNNGAATYENIRLQHNTVYYSAGYGGGFYNAGGAPVLKKVTFIQNEAISGGGMYNAVNVALTMEDVNFTSNRATAGGGGGLFLATGSITIKRGVFDSNISTSSGGGIRSAATITGEDLTFKNNTSTTIGAGIYNVAGGTLNLNRASFIANVSGTTGGGIYNENIMRLDNVMFSRNSTTQTNANGFGGGIYHYGGTAVLTNVTFSNNISSYINAITKGGAALYARAGSMTVYNSIFWGNKRGNGIPDQFGGTATVANSLVEGGFTGGTNISIGNPVFINADADNLRLKGGSPAIDIGNNSLTGTLTDLDNNSRKYNNTVDLGAYENQGSVSLIIAPATLAAYNRGDNFNIPLTVTGDYTGLTWSVTGALPEGLTLKPSGLLSGRPLKSGLYTFVVSVTNGELNGNKQYALQINDKSAILYTNSAAVAGSNDGSSWENGFTDLKVALSKSLAGDQIWVAKGTYIPGWATTDWFTLKEGVQVYGGFAGTEATLAARDMSLILTANASILDGSYGGNRHVVFNNVALTSATVLDGFMITGGQTMTGNDGDNYRGGGIYNGTTSKAVYSNLRIVNNRADRGAGIYNNTGAATFSKIILEGNAANTYGGGMYNLSSSVNLTDFTFKDNTAKLYGGGLVHNTGVITLSRVSFTGNTAGQQAGGMYHLAGTANLANVSFSRNAVTTAGSFYGGGMYVAAAANLTNVTFSNNTIAFIHATTVGGAGLYRAAGVVNAGNSIFWGNKRGNGIADQLNAGVALGQSIVQAGYAAGTGVLIGDPLFKNADLDNLTLRGGSPAVDAGANNQNGALTDLAGNTRVVNGVIDLGAYENQGDNGLKILPATIGVMTRGTDPKIQMTATGGNGNYTWTIQSGKLPVGLNLTASGQFKGVPTVSGTYTFVIAANDGDLAGSKQYTVSVNVGPVRLYVSQSAAGGNNGSSWEDAFTDLKPALAQVIAGDEIWTARGTYSPGPLASSYFTLKEGVKIYGGFAGTELLFTERDSTAIRSTNETALDGSIEGVGSYHVIYNTVALTPATVLDGFSIQGGKALGSSGGYGGGIYNTAGAAVFRHLWIKNNTGVYGAGLYHNGEASYTDLIFSNNVGNVSSARGGGVYNAKGFKLTGGVFEGNTVTGGYGAAIYSTAALELINTRFLNNNSVNGYGGAIYSSTSLEFKATNAEFTGNRATYGGAVYVSSGITTFNTVTFRDNASTAGGAIYSNTALTLNRASFINNTSVNQGGAIWAAGTLVIDNSIFSRNRVTGVAAYTGGAIYTNSGTSSITNTSFSNNSIAYVSASTTVSYGGAIYRAGGTMNAYNNIFWGNTRGNGVADQLNAGVILGNSIVQNGYTGGTEIKIGEPLFQDAAADDLRLKPGSLAIDAGDNGRQFYTKDLSGNTRIQNSVIDLGALENDGAGQLVISPVNIGPIKRGVYLDLQLSYTGSVSPVTWVLKEGKLPIGMVFTADGRLRGTPTLVGKYTFVIGVGDGTLVGNRQYTVIVNPGIVRLYVRQLAAGDNTGSNWENALTALQPAMAQAEAGDEIWVAGGTYSAGPSVTSFFVLKEGVKMYGGFAGTETAVAERDSAAVRGANESILDGSEGGSYHVVYNIAALTSATVLDGFSLQGGRAVINNGSSSVNYSGGGLYNTAGAAVFRHLWIKNNWAKYGGGIYHSGNAVYSNIIISTNQAGGPNARGAGVYNAKDFNLTDGIIEENRMVEATVTYGAGIFNAGNSNLTKVKFVNNTLTNGQGGAIYSTSGMLLNITKAEFSGSRATTGGAVFMVNGTLNLNETVFRENIAVQSGGAIYTSAKSSLNRVSFINNTSQQYGGAIWNNGNLQIDNSIFSRNTVTGNYYGGAVFNSSGIVLINNTSFSNNSIGYINASTTLSYGGALYRSSGTITLHNDIFWGNKRGNNVADQLNAGITVASSIVENNYAAGTNIKIGNPMFKNAAADDLRLTGGSMAIDAGEKSWQAFDLDLDGRPRIVNSIIDIGAYENDGGASLTINPATIAPIKRGTYLDLPLTFTGSDQPVTWSFQGGKLPVGLVFTAEGHLRGTPTLAGSYTFVVGATDGTLGGNRQYTLIVQAGVGRLFVHQSATGDNNGSNWENAFTDLQTALSQSINGDEIWVAQGTYYTGPAATSSFTLKEGVKLYGGFAGTETLLTERDSAAIQGANETILDGSQGVPSYHVVYNAVALTAATVLDGFSIQGSGSISNAYYLNGNYYGGGIYNTAGVAIFRNLWIKNNVSTYGAALYHNGNASYTNIRFSNNRTTGSYARGGAVYSIGGFKLKGGIFEDNKIIQPAGTPGYGAAIFNNGLMELTDVRFDNNSVTNGYGGAIYSSSGTAVTISKAAFNTNSATTGGAVYIANGTPNLSDIVFKDNTAAGMGGALYISGSMVLNRAAFINNTAVQNGGAIWSSGNLKMDNSIFSRNSVTSASAYYGGAVYIYTGTVALNNNSFTGNSINYAKTGTVNYGGAIYRNSGTVTLSNSIFWGNKRGGEVTDQLNLLFKVSNSVVQGGYATGVNIIDADPAFVNAAADDLSLTGCSPAINTGDNSLALGGATDYAGKVRTTGSIVDMGAVEYQDAVIVLNPAVLPDGRRGQLYNQQLVGTGGGGIYAFNVISGKLPDGLSMESTGLITGNPIVIGKYSFVVNMTDGGLCGTRVYNIEVLPGTGPVHILVNQAATGGHNNGSTWANAYLELSTALKVSLAGDEIWVARGTYSPGALVTNNFVLKEGVKIYGGFAATENLLSERDSLRIRTDNETLLDGGNINRHVVFNNALLTSATLLDGFSISGGRTLAGNSTGEPYIGGGIYNLRGAASFNNLWIKNNNASSYGGGMYNAGTSLLSKITFESNTVTAINNGSYRYGGGLYNAGANVLNNIEFINNAAYYGGGLYLSGTSATINNILFRENSATYGGGLYAYSGKVILNRASFIGNVSLQHGAGIYQYVSTLTINGGVFSRNTVTQPGAFFGGAYYQYSGTVTLNNVTMGNNSIAYVNATVNKYGGAIYKNSGVLNLQNSILWGNMRGNGVTDELNLNIKAANSLIRDGYAAGTLIVNTDPLFNMGNPDDLSLSDCSPAINMGDNTFSAGITRDILGKDRVKALVVDLGAYENQQDRITITPAILPAGIRGNKYLQQLSATGGNGNYTYAVSYGKLPDGLIISTSGKITGRPINAGIYTFNITAKDGTLCGNRMYTVEAKLGSGAVRIYVNQNATSGMDNGANWENGYLDLQKGFASALARDTVWVARGDYSPGAKVTSYFTLKEGVKIIGGFAGTEEELAERDSTAITTTNETVLNGGNKSYHVIYNAVALTRATVLDGFSIVGGLTATGGGTGLPYTGAGILNSGGNMTFRNLWVKNNKAFGYGGGIYNNAPAEFINVVLENNTSAGFGGGIYNSGLANFSRVKFIGNKAVSGGGMYNITNIVTLKNVVFNGNIATSQGGGFYNGSNGKPVFTGASFIGNTAVQNGAGIYQLSGTLDVVNGVFSQNRITGASAYAGAAIYHNTGITTLVNLSVSNNTINYVNPSATTSYGAGLYRYTGTVNIYNSIFWGNRRGNDVPDQMNAGIGVATSTIEKGYKTGTAILTVDPQFTNAAADDLSIASCSPSVNMGDNSKVPGIKTDVAGGVRIKNDKVDIGAYEFQGLYLENVAQDLPDADQWSPYSHQIVITDNGAHTYSLSQGLLPDGLVLSPGGILSGTPTVPGTYQFSLAIQGSGVCGSLKIKLKVVKKPTWIIEILKPYPVPVRKDVGTPFDQLNLVTQVEVVMSDNSHARFPVTWLPGNYDGTVEGVYTLTGTLTVPTPDVNRNNLLATAKVAVLIPVYPYIVAVAQLNPVSVLSGTAFADVLPLLPKKVKVTYDDLVTTDQLNLVWKQGIYDTKAGVYRLYADLVLKEEHANPAEFEAYIDVYVQKDIIAVEAQTDIAADLHTLASALPLPASVRVTYHDQTTGFLDVLWDTSTYFADKGAEYDLKGVLQLDPLVSNSKGLYAENKVIIRRNIVSVKPVAGVSTPYGTDFDEVALPEKVTAVFDDGTTDVVGVEWKPGNYDALQSGAYPLTGTLLYDETEDNKQNVEAAMVLTVLAKPKNIVSVSVLDTVAVSYGTLAKDIAALKTTVRVTYDDGTTGNLNMTWDTAEYDPLSPQDYTFDGEPVLITGVTNKDLVTAQITIKLTSKSITAIENPAPATVKYGIAAEDLELPETVNVTYNDHSKGTESVWWTSDTYNPLLEGSYVFKGSLLLSDDIGNPDSLYAEMTVKVGPKPLTIVSIAADSVTVPFGTNFTDALLLFPKQVMATYDNGTTGSLNVTWAEGDYQGGEPGVYTLTGTAETPDGVVNPDEVTGSLKVTIGNHIISSYAVPAALNVVFGTDVSTLILPSSLNTVFVDGANQDLEITWDTSDYNGNLSGKYVIKGAFVLPDDVENPRPVIPQIEVNVLSRAKIILELKTDTLHVSYGTLLAAIPYPATSHAKLDEGPETDIPVLLNSFKSIDYDASIAGEYNFEGALVLPDGIQNPDNVTAKLLVVVGKKSIVSLVAPDTLQVDYDTDYESLTLPEGVTVKYNNNTEEVLAVTWAQGNYDGKTAGTYTLQGTLTVPDEIDNPLALQPVITVVVAPRIRTLVSVVTDSLSVPYGTTLALLGLPATVTGAFDDGSTAPLTVKAWTNTDYDPLEKGTYPFAATFEMPVNTQNTDHVTALLNVKVESRYIISIAPVDAVSVVYGTPFSELTLPATVNVTYNNNEVGSVPVTWEAGAYDGLTAGDYQLKGILLPDAPEENKDDKSASIKVTVRPLQLMIDSILIATPVHFPFGTTLTQVLTALGTQLDVHYTNDTQGKAGVTWESTLFNGNQPATYNFTGLIGPAADAANPKDLLAKVQVVIDRKNIISVEAPAALNDVYGKLFSELDLPSAVKVTYDDQTTEELPVLWNEEDYQSNIFTQQTITGEIQLTDDVTNTLNLKAEIKVTLQKDIVSVAAIAPITTYYGTPISNIGLPATVEVTYNDGSKENLAIVWDAAAYAAATIGDVTLAGALTLAPDTYNTTAQAAAVTVTIKKAVQTLDFTLITDKVYGDEPFKLIAVASSGLPVSFKLISGNLDVTADLATIIGTGAVTVKAFQAGNALIDSVASQQTFMISKALLTVTGDNLTRLTEFENPVLTYHLSGFKYDEVDTILRESGNLRGEPALSTTATIASEPGVYPVTVAIGDLQADNYEFTFEPGSLTVNSRFHIITWDTKGGTVVAPVQVEDQAKVTPATTTKDGYQLYTWYSDASMETVYNFDAPVTADLTLYADWQLPPLPASGPISMKTIANYMLGLGELTTTETSVPYSILLLNTKSHLTDKTAPFKLSDWYSYGELKKAVISTIPATDGTVTSALTGVNITGNGGSAITAAGVCWSTTANPTVAANKIAASTLSGLVPVTVPALTAGIKYYLKAYATNGVGTVYGDEIVFMIKGDGSIQIIRK